LGQRADVNPPRSNFDGKLGHCSKIVSPSLRPGFNRHLSVLFLIGTIRPSVLSRHFYMLDRCSNYSFPLDLPSGQKAPTPAPVAHLQPASYQAPHYSNKSIYIDLCGYHNAHILHVVHSYVPNTCNTWKSANHSGFLRVIRGLDFHLAYHSGYRYLQIPKRSAQSRHSMTWHLLLNRDGFPLDIEQ